MRTNRLAATILATALALTFAHAALAQEIILRNDGFESGGNAVFQGGFAAGEVGASRFTPPVSSLWRINRVQLLFGGSTASRNITLHIWEDADGTNDPGDEIYSADFTLTGSNQFLQEIVVISDNLQVTGAFRVGIEFQVAGLPSIARDDDGTIHDSQNFILAEGFGWQRSSLFGVSGDWIIRAGVENLLAGVGDPGAPALSLAPAGANPSRNGRLALAVTLPTDAPARLDLFDTSGRRVDSRDVGALGPGRHVVDFSASAARAPGIYVARLSQGHDAKSTRLAVLR